MAWRGQGGSAPLALRRSLGLLLPVIVCLAPCPLWPAEPRTDQPLRLERGHPRHIQPEQGIERVLPRYPLPPGPYMFPPASLEGRTVYRFDRPLRDVARIAPELSELCRRGAFNQQIDGLFRAADGERGYSVGFGNGANLYDPLNKRMRGTVYFFHAPDTGQCQVFTVAQDRIADSALFR